MLKSTWRYIALGVGVAATGGGAHYYIVQAALEEPMLYLESTTPPIAPLAPRGDEMECKTLESIGSIKRLDAVPLQSASRR